MFRLIEKILTPLSSFSGSLASMISFSHRAKQSCMARPTLIDLYLDEYNEGLRYYPFKNNFDRCNESSNNLDDPCNKIYAPNKT